MIEYKKNLCAGVNHVTYGGKIGLQKTGRKAK